MIKRRSAITKFFIAYPQPLDIDSFRRILTQTINSAKATNATVRLNSVGLFKVLIARSDPLDPDNLSRVAVPDLLNLPMSGKSAGPDHRISLYSMLAFLTPAASVSTALIQTTTPLLAKETHEGVTSVLAAALPPHIIFLLREGSLPPETIQLIAKEMSSVKPGVRRAFCGLAGSVFFEGKDILETESGTSLAKALLPSFELSLKIVSSNPLNSSGGPFEGYVAVAILLGPLTQSKKFGKPQDGLHIVNVH